MDIKIGVGYGEFTFGMSESDIINIFGKPNKIYFGDFNEPYFEYNKEQVILKFQVEDKTNIKRLSLIEVKNKKATIINLLVWNLSKSKIKKIFEKKFKRKASLEDYNSIETICFDDYWLEFCFELGKLTSINIEVLLDENEIWQVDNGLQANTGTHAL